MKWGVPLLAPNVEIELGFTGKPLVEVGPERGADGPSSLAGKVGQSGVITLSYSKRLTERRQVNFL